MPTATATKNHGLRKAAILVASLDSRSADLLLDRMGERQARLVRDAVMELDEIDPAEQQRVIEEFFRVGPLVPGACPPGIELDGQLARRFAPAVESHPIESPQKPFRFLRDAEADKLAKILAAEGPQVIALVLSHLMPEQAGNVLVRLGPAMQVDVVRRLIDLEETDPEILRDVERGLETRLFEQIRMQRRRVAGMAAVSGILESSEQRVGMQILQTLAAHDRSLAEKFRTDRVRFQDLLQMADRSLGELVEAADVELVVLALVGAPPAWIDRFLRHMPEPEARAIRYRLDHFGPIRLSDVEEARNELAKLAERLAMSGQVELPRKMRLAA